MNKLFTRIMASVAGFAMAIGVGVGAADSKAKPLYADPTWEKASSVSVGDVITLVYETGSAEIGGISTSSTKYGLSTSYSGTPTGVFPLTVVAGNGGSNFALKNGNDYLFWSSGNSLNKKTTLDNSSSWTISISNGNATIANVGDSGRVIKYNNNSGQLRFACYTSGQQSIQIYKQTNSGGEEPPVLTPMDAPTISLSGTIVSWTNIVGNNGYSYSITGTASKSGDLAIDTTSLDVSTLNLAYGNYSITVTTKGDNLTTSNSVPSNAQVFVLSEPTVSGTFNKVTSSSLAEGDYVLTYQSYVMGNTISSSKVQNSSQSFSSGAASITNPLAGAVWHIAPSGDYFTLYNAIAEKYLKGPTSNGTTVSLVDDTSSDQTKWILDAGTGVFDFVAYSFSTRALRTTGSGWGAYATASNGGPLTLYKKFVAATNISLDNDELLIGVGSQGNLVATLTPSNADSNITWSSSDEDVATVNQSGVVTGVDAGTATITARVSELIYAECEVTVTAASIPAESVTLDKDSNTLIVGQTDSLTAEVLPANTTDNLVWSTTNSNVATVDDGLVTAVGAGSATITATAGEQSAQYSLTVQPLTAETNYVDAHVNIKGKVVAVNGKNTMVDDGTSGLWTYSSSNVDVDVDDIVTVTGTTTNYNGGLEVASAVLTPSSGEITTISAEPISEQQVADIIAARAASASYYVMHRKVSLRTGPVYADGNFLKWSYGSSTMEASISTSGMQANKVYDIEGYLVNFYNSILCICVTSATEPALVPEGISLSESTLSVEIGGHGNLAATIAPNGASANVTWSSSDEDVATVNQNGVVTGVAAGTATITARVSETIYDECEVTVVTPTRSTNQTLFTADLTHQASVDNDDLTITAEASEKTGYYEDGSGTERYFLVKGTSPLFSFEPYGLVFKAVLGGGSAKNPLDNAVRVCFVDSDDNEIESTRATVTSAITTKDATEYTVIIPYSENAYGIKLSHTKESGYNVRYYSFSLSYSLGFSRAVLSGNETNDGNSVTVDSVKMTFGASIPSEVWSGFGTIEDYGVMMYKTTKAPNAIAENSIQQRVRNGQAVSNFHKGSGEATPDGDVYNFSAYVNFPDNTKYNVIVCAAPYIVVDGTYYFFDEMHYSVNLLAEYHLANGGSNLSDAALNVLAGN